MPDPVPEIILIGMPEPNWSELRHAYGSAEDLPDLLAELEPDPKAAVWGELWGRVCHQGTTYSASPHILPFLIEVAADWEACGRVMPLFLAACIVAAPETNVAGYESYVAQFRQLALGTLASNELSRADRIYVVQSVLAFEGDRLWGVAFERLNDGEFSGTCPGCNTVLCLVIGQYGFYCSADDWVRDSSVPRTEVFAVDPGQLPKSAERLYVLCSGDTTVQDWICRLFGRSTCPNCHQSIDVATAIAAFETPEKTG